jgi:SAM-dependent methyltransferase
MNQRIVSWRHRSREAVHQSFRNPDVSNLPETYLDSVAANQPPSQFLVDTVKKLVDTDCRILEIGCNVGRNLNCLFKNGYYNLTGIEINEKAVQLLKQAYPEMAAESQVIVAPVEEVIRQFGDGEFDLVFTLATLMHIHPSSEWIFREIVRITKMYVVTIENESDGSWRAFPRNYKTVFERLGMRQVEEASCKS